MLFIDTNMIIISVSDYLLFYRVVQFTLLLVVWVQAEPAAELAEVTVHVDAILTIGANEPFLMNVAQRR